MKTIEMKKVAKFCSRFSTKRLLLGGLSMSLLGLSSGAYAQTDSDVVQEEIVVTGIRASLASALDDKRNTDNLIEVIQAQDIGKLPDQNLAEVLENITGIQITREAGIGTGVQIRGSNENRVEINGVSTVASDGARTGISFEDLNASIISSVEVTKAPTAKTIEGSVGGTVNLKTIRPLDLDKTLVSVRLQGEDSNQSTESIKPRLSGAFGDSWETSIGRVGFIFSGSYTEQEAVSTRPRVDRDNPITRDALTLASLGDGVTAGTGALTAAEIAAAPEEFLGIQFLLNERENQDFETINIATTLEWAPNENTRFWADAVINEQERAQEQFRIQGSGVSVLDLSFIPSEFETVDFGSVGGEREAALVGSIEPNQGVDGDDPNLRLTTETSSRVTDSDVFSFGGEWTNDKWTISSELSFSKSETTTPQLDTTLNFLNPNCSFDADDVAADTTGTIVDNSASSDNCVPFIFDIGGSSIDFGINFGDDPDLPTNFAPSRSDLLQASNVQLRNLSQTETETINSEDAFRIDLSYAFDDNIVKSVDFGYRYSETESSASRINGSIGSFNTLVDSPNGSLFAELLTETETDLGDVLLIDAEDSFNDPERVIAILERALAVNRLLNPTGTNDITLDVTDDQNAFYEIEEDTHALYAQANFEYGIFRGNIGARYIDTDVETTSNPLNANAVRVFETTSVDYDFFLPRFNLIAQPHEDVIIRFGYGQDIRRPDFNDLSPGFNFNTNENTTVLFGNAELVPEEVDSLDLAVEWYFAPSAVASIGYFRKKRDAVIRSVADGAILDPNTGFREVDPNCPGGGVFNPIAEHRLLGPNAPDGVGLCVDASQEVNDDGSTTQTGFELAVQYDLSSFEDSLGWASGFGVIANATFQDFSGDSVEDETFGRGLSVLGEQTLEQGLLDFSETAYNFTLYYEKYGLSARARYTWRDEFRTQDFGGGSSTSSTFSFPVVTEARGQLNLSVNYDINDQFNVGVEVVNATEEGIVQNCVTSSGPICFSGEPDRRVTFGASYRF